MMRTIFISHAHEDNIMTDAYANELVRLGYQVWYDRNRLYGGEMLTPEISHQLAGASALIVFLSINSVKKRWVLHEVELFTRHASSDASRLLLPVRITECDVPELLEDILYIEGVGVLFEDTVTSIVKALERPRTWT